MINNEILEKWKNLIKFAKSYWIDSTPTGISDSDFDELEKKAILEDNFSVRDYVLSTYMVGKKYQNKYIEKLKKFKINDTMLNAIIKSANELGISYNDLYCDLKYDGSSIAIYIDSITGKPKHIVTCGNQNLSSEGVDQTWKLINFIPKKFPKGIVAIQCEALIELNNLGDLDPEKARQKANGLINSIHCSDEVNNLLTLRAYRYYLDDSYYGKELLKKSYREVLNSLETITINNRITFSSAQSWTLQELLNMENSITESNKVQTNTGKFLADGWVLYNKTGTCQRALKFAGAGSGTESIKTIVKEIQWNDQSDKGKDSWSANVIVNPVTIGGSIIKKPSAGSVSKLLKNNITPGATIGIILANSTIPMVGEVFNQGNGNYMWPTCSCGYTLGPSDIYGSLIKCGNPLCNKRIERMRKVVKKNNYSFNDLLVIDRFRWENTNIDKSIIEQYIKNNQENEYYEYLKSFLKTELQKRNLNLVWKASWIVLREEILSKQ